MGEKRLIFAQEGVIVIPCISFSEFRDMKYIHHQTEESTLKAVEMVNLQAFLLRSTLTRQTQVDVSGFLLMVYQVNICRKC